MADGEITLRLDANTSRLLKEAADAEGVTPEAIVSRLVSDLALDLIDWPDDVASGLVDPDPAIDKRIAEETRERDDGIPWEVFQERLRNFGRPKG